MTDRKRVSPWSVIGWLIVGVIAFAAFVWARPIVNATLDEHAARVAADKEEAKP